MSQMMMLAGGNDPASTLFSENITVNTGATDAGYLYPMVMERKGSDL